MPEMTPMYLEPKPSTFRGRSGRRRRMHHNPRLRHRRCHQPGQAIECSCPVWLSISEFQEPRCQRWVVSLHRADERIGRMLIETESLSKALKLPYALHSSGDSILSSALVLALALYGLVR